MDLLLDQLALTPPGPERDALQEEVAATEQVFQRVLSMVAQAMQNLVAAQQQRRPAVGSPPPPPLHSNAKNSIQGIRA